MTLGEKLSKLRKEQGLTQDVLAGKLSTTRQAISKWENDQEFPDAEQLLMIGNLFDVLIDYLLKDTVERNNDIKKNEEGYFVSEEFAEGYLFNIQKISKFVGFSFSLIALSFLPYFIFNKDPSMYLLPT